MDASTDCPCGAGAAYGDCCGRWHAGPARLAAPTPEALMRSRYSAYVLAMHDYLLETWHASTRPAAIEDTAGVKWLGLDVRRTALQDPDHVTVEFVVRSRRGGRGHRLHETSRFVREDGRWLYVAGDLR